MSVVGVLVCHPDPSRSCSAEFTYWADAEEARLAAAELTPCGPLCIGVHSVVCPNREPDRKRKSSLRTRTTVECDDADVGNNEVSP